MQTHDHTYKKTHRLGSWGYSPDRELMYAYDEYINICTECGDVKPIKTSHRGKLTKSVAQTDIEKIKIYPAKWRLFLEQLLRMKRRTVGDIEFVLASALKQSGMRWSEMQECVDRLLKDGIVERYEFFPKRSPDLNRIIIRSDTVAHLLQTLGLNEPNAVKENIDYFFQSWEYPADELPAAALALAKAIDTMKHIWVGEGAPSFVDTENVRREIKSLSNYMLLLDAVKEMFNIVMAGEYIGFRELSVRLTGDSKELTSIKPYLKLAFESLEPFGVVEHSPLLYCRMPVTGAVEERTIELDLCHDYVVLTMETARAFRPVAIRMKKLILIENQTPFEKCAKLLKLTAKEDTGVIFVSGYPPSHIRDFVKKLLRFYPFEGLIWCDLDPDGIQIALTISEWFKEYNYRTILMEKEHIHVANSRALTTHDIQKIEELEKSVKEGPLRELLTEMTTAGQKVEQEAQIFPIDLYFLNPA